MASRFPVSTAQFSSTVQGCETHFVLSGYDDHIMVLATQIGRMGTILQARKEEGECGELSYSVNVLMGRRDEPLLVACARQLIELISNSGSSRSLVLSLGLKDHSQETKIFDSVAIQAINAAVKGVSLPADYLADSVKAEAAIHLLGGASELRNNEKAMSLRCHASHPDAVAGESSQIWDKIKPSEGGGECDSYLTANDSCISSPTLKKWRGLSLGARCQVVSSISEE
ncbi:hypothetical protein SELMODRAFT_402918 [Selaginella moellendorffii]|uniref:Uncharacterized protein n=1 Tax=Selaginella moellendorffii TaxID=88036 RepID=D8QNG4_SELML|nr:hypothetical protein SELMODRAFT_402918 [Selaginella moellendorffii]